MANRFQAGKGIIIIAMLVIVFSAQANSYYISNSGSDNNSGTAATTPWKTLNKVNSAFNSMRPGDNIFFKRGEVFYGTITIIKSGLPGSPITIGAYGKGPNPVITGFTTVSSWTNSGGNIWESSGEVSSLPACNMVAINGVNTAMGRYPNAEYLTFQSHTGHTTITSSSLGAVDWTGAEVVIRKNRSIIDRSSITAQSGTTLTYNSGSGNDPVDNFGFFVQNDVRTLDKQNEWYYNPDTKKIKVYSAVSPVDVKVASIDVLISAGNNMNYIVLDNIDFQGANTVAIKLSKNAYFTIQKCNINFSGTDAINSNICPNLTIQNCNISNSNNNAIRAIGYETPPGTFLGGNATISHNTISNTGIFPGMIAKKDNRNGFAIRAEGTVSLIEYNVINNTGFNAIHFDGNSTLVRNNFINYFCLILDDGGGVYAWNSSTTPHAYTGRKVQNNIILNGIGAPAGTSSTKTFADGIYMDDGVQQVEVSGNSVAGCSRFGIFLHNAHELNVHDNTVYNNMQQLGFQQDQEKNHIQNNIIKNNIFVARLSSQSVLNYRNYLEFPVTSLGTADNNYYARPINDNGTLTVALNSGKTNHDLSEWQRFSGMENHSKKSPRTVSDTNDLKFVYNETGSVKIVPLPHKYIDVKNVPYDTSITLPPYTSAVLIRNDQ